MGQREVLKWMLDRYEETPNRWLSSREVIEGVTGKRCDCSFTRRAIRRLFVHGFLVLNIYDRGKRQFNKVKTYRISRHRINTVRAMFRDESISDFPNETKNTTTYIDNGGFSDGFK